MNTPTPGAAAELPTVAFRRFSHITGWNVWEQDGLLPGSNVVEALTPHALAQAQLDALRDDCESWQQQASSRTEDALRFAAERDALRDEVARLTKERDEWRAMVTSAHREREAAVSAHEAAQRAGFQFRDEVLDLRRRNARLRDGLLEVCRVLETNTTAIVDTVWVSDGSPETLLDRCLAAIAEHALKAQPTDVDEVMALADEWTTLERRYERGNASSEACDAAREALRAKLAARKEEL
jgi:chromosome segregation ATPase